MTISSVDVIRDIEHQRLRALVAGDVELARTLHSDDYELIPPGGGTVSKAEYLGRIESGELRYDVFGPASEMRVRV